MEKATRRGANPNKKPKPSWQFMRARNPDYTPSTFPTNIKRNGLDITDEKQLEQVFESGEFLEWLEGFYRPASFDNCERLRSALLKWSLAPESKPNSERRSLVSPEQSKFVLPRVQGRPMVFQIYSDMLSKELRDAIGYTKSQCVTPSRQHETRQALARAFAQDTGLKIKSDQITAHVDSDFDPECT